MTGLQLGVGVLGNAVSCALGLLYKHVMSLHPLLGAASLNPPKQHREGMNRAELHTGQECPVSAGHSDGLFDLESFPLMKSQLTHQLYLALSYSQLK